MVAHSTSRRSMITQSLLARRRGPLPTVVKASTTSSSFFSTTKTTMTKGAGLHPLNLSDRAPSCSLVPPGRCQFDPTFRPVPLLDRVPCGSGGTSYVLRFGLPDPTRPMDLTTCACVLASAELMDRERGELVDVVRPYTPISANDQVGSFDLLIKDYGEGGWLSRYMCEELPIGGTVSRFGRAAIIVCRFVRLSNDRPVSSSPTLLICAGELQAHRL